LYKRRNTVQEFKKLLPGISGTVLADGLLELEGEGLKRSIQIVHQSRISFNSSRKRTKSDTCAKELGVWTSRWNVPRIIVKQKQQQQEQLSADQLVSAITKPRTTKSRFKLR
jgi:DNA-binding HxlR family transcriptional regulator